MTKDGAETVRRWKSRPPGSNWGEFGPDDEIGRLNLITPQKVLEGVAEVREGRSFCLSLPLDLPGGGHGSRFAPKLFATGGQDAANMNKPLATAERNVTDILCDDAVTMALQYSTQWDALCHVGHHFDADGDGVAEAVYYNGWRAGRDVCDHDHGGALHLGIEKMAEKAIQGRAVLVDLQRHLGAERRIVGYNAIKAIIDTDRIDIRPGDIVCFHSGYSQALVEMGGNPDMNRLRHLGAELDGSDEKLLQWISESGIAAIAADTAAVETFRRPSAGGEARPLLPLHEHCLFKLGIPLGEYWWLSPLAKALAAAGRTGFLLTAPPLRLPRAVGSPVTPVGTI